MRSFALAPESRLHWAWIILGTCFLNLFIAYSVRLGYGVVLPEMIRDLGLSRTAGGSIFNAYLFTYICVTPLTGYLTDRFGARVIIPVCALILGIGVLLMGTATSLWTACLYFGLAGLGATGMWTPVISVVQRWFSPNRRGMALGILSTGYGLGFAAMGALFPVIVSSLSWRYAWYFLGAGALFMIALNGFLLRSSPESAGARPWGTKPREAVAEPLITGSTPKGMIRSIFRERTFWLIGLSYFCISYSLYGITTFMVDYARYQLGVPLEQASLLATIHGLGQIAGVLIILPFSDRVGRRRMTILSNSLITLVLIGILTLPSSFIILGILIGFLAVFYGATFPIYGLCAGDYFPREIMATVIGAWTPFYGGGAILVHWVSGYLRDSSGNYDTAFVLNIIAGAAAVGFMAMVRKRVG